MSMETNESYVSLRLATKEDVPHIMKLIHQMAEFERLTHICVATEASLESTLFDAPPFQGPTIILLQISPALPKQNNINPNESLEISVQKLGMNPPVNDPHAEDFVSALGNGTTVAGFVIFFRNYSTFLAKPGFYIEEIFVREPYRRRGLGTILLKAVAGKAVELGFGRVEWTVLDWNGSAIQFYEKMEAQVLPDWRLCRLTGKALEDCWH